MQAPIRSVLIVGGGTAGWMTAAALGVALRGRCEIRLLEPAESGEDTGVLLGAESTLPALRAFHGLLGLDEDRLVASTGATFKLGAELIGWSGADGGYINPHGEFGATLDGVAFHDLWAAQPDGEPLEQFSLAAVAARLGRFVRPGTDPRSVASTMSYALHLDAARYAAALRERALAAGVTRRPGRIGNVDRRRDGFIEQVVTETGERVAADLFIDCSGPEAVLSNDGAWEDWSAWLPVDRLTWTWREAREIPSPLTRIEATLAGYRLRIPLQGRTAEALAYASRFAADSPDLGEGALSVRFTPGRRAQPWARNAVAIGRSAAALEPLGATGLHLVQSGVSKLLGLFPDRSFGGGEAAEYNRLMGEELDRIRDYLILHYRLNGRRGEPLWDHARTMPIPDSVAWKIRLFESRGRVVLFDEETFLEPSWIALFLGQGVIPRRHHPRADHVPQLAEKLGRMRQLIRQAAESMPAHADYIARYGAAR